MSEQKSKIESGDRVIVNFNNTQHTLCAGIVQYIPMSTGDGWIILADNGDIHYISEGCTITKEAKGESMTEQKSNDVQSVFDDLYPASWLLKCGLVRQESFELFKAGWDQREASSAPIQIAKLEQLLRADKDRRQGERRDRKEAA